MRREVDAFGVDKTTGAQRLIDTLLVLGVDLVFGLPGVHNLSIWAALAHSRIRLVGVRHEQTAVYAADGYARTSGRLGVAIVTTGPGAANTLAATGEAMASGSPVLVVATDISTGLRREGVHRGVLHETRDQAAMFGPVVKRAYTVDSSAELADDLVRACQLACASPSGPVYLGVPTDLLGAPAVAPAKQGGHSVRPRPDEHSLTTALELIGDSERPLIWAGGGAVRADAGPAVAALAERLVAPVITTFAARGLLARTHPCAVSPPVHVPQVGALWDNADLVIAIGTDFDGMMTQNWAMPAPARMLAINVDEADAGKNYRADITLVGDARLTTETLVQRVSPRVGLVALSDRLSAISHAVRHATIEDDATAMAFLDVMDEVVPSDAVLVADMCIPGYWLAGFHRVAAPRRLAYPVGWGTLGFGFPASLGAAMAGAGRAICVCGDGGFLFACGELATVAQEQLALTVILVDDGGYGMLRFDQTHARQEPFGVDLQTPDFVALVRSFGIEASVVDGFGDAFRDRLTSYLNALVPNVLVVRASLRPPPTTSPRWYRRSVVVGRGRGENQQEKT